MASNAFCRHYPSGGMGDNTHCKVGIDMRSVCHPTARPIRSPCYHPDVSYLCARHEAYTAEELRREDEEFARAFKAMLGVMAGTSDECPYCKAHIESMDQVGKCVYARPCGCRQFQGKVPKAWQTNRGEE